MPVSSQKSRVAVGLLNASGYTTGWSIPWNTAAIDVTTIADTAKAFIPGQTDWSMQVDMILDTIGTANGQFDVVHDWKATTAQPIAIAPEGFAAGSIAVMGDALETTATSSAQIAGRVEVSVSAVGTDALDSGVSLDDFTAITADGNGTARNNGAATANGGVAQLHVTAFSGLTNNIVTIEHSVDGSTSWATLVTFATYTAPTTERVVVAPGTTVRQYLRVVDNVTGTGSTTRAVLFARR